MADEDHEEKSLTPAIKPPPPPVTVDETLSIELRKQHRGFRNRTICCGIITAVILIISVVMLILGFTIFHVKNPKINLNSVTLTGLDRVNSTGLATNNLTVVADVSVKNPNVAAFKFEKTNSSLYYRGAVVSVADIPAGVAKARRTVRLDVTFPVTVAEIARNPQLVSDFMAGKPLLVESYTKIVGKVKILHIIKRKVTVTMNCSIAVNATGLTIVNQECKKHVSI
ncbi:late embryogenesis abundant protein At1g64065-like [Bidens hawaiensis]|uniref:late embryogenesis abundant protein At1g64065-like n=1 Tax=Bidens hawaiensis TaxID=980011 RepID=UPI00404A7632